MRRPTRTLAVLATAAVLVAGGCSDGGDDGAAAATTTTATPATDPDGLRPGVLVEATPAEPTAALGDARRTLLRYGSTDHAGDPVEVTGVLLVPDREAPDGGWPVISWAHGTTGVADACAPSPTDNLFYNEYAQQARAFLDAGYAVVATDYRGLGTPGPHPYLIGDEEGAAVVDAVQAAREVEPDLADTWFAVGHSQGGQAALFATQVDPAERDLPAAAVAIAPASGLELLLPAVVHADAPADLVYGIYALAGLAAVDPTVDLEAALGPVGREQLDLILEDGCLVATAEQLGDVHPDDLFDLTDDQAAELSERLAELGNPDRGTVTGPVLIIQGATDVDVPAGVTRNLVAALEGAGADVTYQELPDLGHDAVLGPSVCDLLDYLAAHGGPDAADCVPQPTDLS